MPASSIGIIVLAAGSSSRMNGQPKQFLEFEGRTLLHRAAETALKTRASQTIVVLGANSERAAQEISDLPLTIVVNENWSAGIGESIKIGVNALLQTEKNLAAVVVMLCDQPFVTEKTINRLIEKFEQTDAQIVASFYHETFGVPALFGSEIFDDLANLSGDTGAKTVLKKHRAKAVFLPAPEAAFDVDTEADFKRLLSN